MTPPPKPPATQLRALALAANSSAGLPDAELVRRYADAGDEAAFEVLVWRHGPLVWGTCRRILRHRQDAEDAFQATFLALARSARAVAGWRSVAAWLHRVSTNAAIKVCARRRPTAALPADGPTEFDADPADREVAAVIDRELARLPERYRAAFVLCCLEGKTNADAARELGCPVGTVDSRLHAARRRLRARLARLGFDPGAVAGLTFTLAVPPSVRSAAVSCGLATFTPPPAIARLANQLGRPMTHATATAVAATAVLALAVTAASIWGFEKPQPMPEPAPVRRPVAPVPRPVAAEPSLLFTEMVLLPGETGSRTVRLVRAKFRAGKLTDREELYTGDLSEFGHHSPYRVIGNRHVVFHSATVFDLAAKKVIHSLAGGRILAVEGTRVYFFTLKVDGEPGVFRFDTATGKREKVADPGAGRWGLRGAVSPDGTKAIMREVENVAVLEGQEMPFGIALDRVGKPRQKLGEFAATCGMTGSGFTPDAPPGVWLDDDRFLTQTTLGKLVVLDTVKNERIKLMEIPPTHKPGEKAWEAAGKIGFTPLGLQQPRFSKMADGRVMYEADIVYFIDAAKKTWEKAEWRPLGHGFESSALPDAIAGADRDSKTVTVTLRHKGKVIGTSESLWFGTPETPRVVATEGHLALVERVRQAGKAIPTDAVRVWSAATGEWQTLDGWADGLIGWVK